MTSDARPRTRGRWRIMGADDAGRSGSLARAADTFVERLHLPKHASWSDLQTAVEAVYGKPILLIASASDGLRAVTGLWIDTADFGAIVCRETDEPHYQAQNAFHELAHILFASAPTAWFSTELPQPVHDLEPATTLLCASSSDHSQEHARVETAVEEVAFAMARAIQPLRRTSEEAYFG